VKILAEVTGRADPKQWPQTGLPELTQSDFCVSAGNYANDLPRLDESAAGR
jgi:hypothetical protein